MDKFGVIKYDQKAVVVDDNNEFNVADYDFDVIDASWSEPITIEIPIELEMLRNKFKGDDRVLRAYAQRVTGLKNIDIKNVYYNRDFKLEMEVNAS